MCDRPDMDDIPHRNWKCEECGAVNSMWDGDCQFCDGPPRPPVNPEAHKFLTDEGAAVLVCQGDADFDDGDAENGPGTWGHPEYDYYQADGCDICIDWRGMKISEIEPEPPEWA